MEAMYLRIPSGAATAHVGTTSPHRTGIVAIRLPWTSAGGTVGLQVMAGLSATPIPIRRRAPGPVRREPQPGTGNGDLQVLVGQIPLGIPV